jgi:hypothetical protein
MRSRTFARTFARNFARTFARTLALSAAIAPLALLATSRAEDRAKNDRTQADQVDRATIDRTQIIGNRELPKVLYIVPWKKPAAGELSGPPVESVLDEALAPIDRDVFRRQVHYNTLTHPAAAAAAPAASDAAAPAAGRN